MGVGISVTHLEHRSPSRLQEPYSDWFQMDLTFGVISGVPYPVSVISWTPLATFPDRDASNVTVEGTVQL